MPDFPKVGGATAAEVAAAILVDPGTDKINGSNIDGLISTRALDSTVAKESGNVATVMAVTNALPTFPADPASNTQVNTRAAPGAQMALTAAEEAAIQGKIIDDTTPIKRSNILKIQDFLEEGFGTLTADGTPQTVREYIDVGKLHCYIDLTNMVAGNSTTIRQFMKIKTAGAYVQYAEETYTGVQTLPLLHITMKPGKFGVKVTLQQAAVVYKSYDWETFVETAAA